LILLYCLVHRFEIEDDIVLQSLALTRSLLLLFVDRRSKVFYSHVVTFCPSLAYLFVQSAFFWTLTLQTRIELIVAFLKGFFGVSGNIACTETVIMSITTTFQRIGIGIEQAVHLWLNLISSAAVWFRVVIQLRL